MMVSDNTAPLGGLHRQRGRAARRDDRARQFDRAVTVRTLVDPAARPDDLTRPGHIFRCARCPAASSGAPATRRRRWTWRGSPAARPRGDLRGARRRRRDGPDAGSPGPRPCLQSSSASPSRT
jgi:hypothetical protein